MLLLCCVLVVVALIFYVIGINTFILMMCHIRLHVILLSGICLDHLEEMMLSNFKSSFIFTSGCCRYPSVFWGFFKTYSLIRNRSPELVGILSSLFNLFNGLYPHLSHLLLKATQYQYHLFDFSAHPITWIPSCKFVFFLETLSICLCIFF